MKAEACYWMLALQEKIILTDEHQHLLNVCEGQTVDASFMEDKAFVT